MIQDIKLTLGGKKRKFTFGLLFIGSVLKRLNTNYIDMFNVLGEDLIKHSPMLFFESLKNTYRIEKKDLDFTEDDIEIWLNKEPFNGIGLINEFEQAFTQSLNNPLPVDEDKKDNVKKK